MKNSLKVERAIKNITREEPAREIRVTRQAINSIELGKFVPSTVLALKLSKYLDKPGNDLFCLKEGDQGEVYAPSDQVVRCILCSFSL